MVGWGEVQSGGIEMTVEAVIESVKKEYYKDMTLFGEA